jgi:nitroreductase
MNDVLKAIKTRRSVKKYKDTPVPEELIDLVLEAGTYAPTGKNRQAPVIIAVSDKETRDKLSRMNAKILGSEYDPFYGAPVIISVISSRSADTYLYDGSVVLENMMLAAHSLGLGACWIHRAKEMYETEEGKELLRSLGIEGEYEGIGNLALGYCDGDYPATRPRKEKYIYRIS